jgi:putative tricarboxylic transport membrane protein
MDVLGNLLHGFAVATTPVNFLYCVLGVFLGTLVGVLPGLGTITGVAILIPLTFGMNPTTALIMLAGIYYGAQYGGSTTAILLNLTRWPRRGGPAPRSAWRPAPRSSPEPSAC